MFQPLDKILWRSRGDAHAPRGHVEQMLEAIGGVSQTRSGDGAGFYQVNSGWALASQQVQGGQRPATACSDDGDAS